MLHSLHVVDRIPQFLRKRSGQHAEILVVGGSSQYFYPDPSFGNCCLVSKEVRLGNAVRDGAEEAARSALLGGISPSTPGRQRVVAAVRPERVSARAPRQQGHGVDLRRCRRAKPRCMVLVGTGAARLSCRREPQPGVGTAHPPRRRAVHRKRYPRPRAVFTPLLAQKSW